MHGATPFVIVLLALILLGQIATVVYVRRTSRSLGSALDRIDARVGRVGARVRANNQEIKALAVRIQASEIETGVDALNRYLLLASRSGEARD
jgi:hypothetical protein